MAFDGPSTGITEYAEHGRDALLAPAADFKAAGEHLAALLEDRQLLDRMKSGALETARAWPSQSEAGELFVSALESLIESHPTTDAGLLSRLESLSRLVRGPSHRALKRLRPSIGRNRLIRSMRHSIEVRRPAINAS